jgi:hypothetical protein
MIFRRFLSPRNCVIYTNRSAGHDFGPQSAASISWSIVRMCITGCCESTDQTALSVAFVEVTPGRARTNFDCPIRVAWLFSGPGVAVLGKR